MSIAFWVTTLVLVVTPGTGVLFTVAAGLSRGGRAGVLAAFACTLGIVPHLASAVTGLAALLHASGVAFRVVQYAGVAYLLFLAGATWRQRGVPALTPAGAQRAGGAPSGGAAVQDGLPAGDVPVLRVISQGVLVNVLNPKLTMFFLAFLPQFLGPHPAHPTVRMLQLAGVFMLVTFVVFAGYGLFAGAARDQVLSRPRVLAWLRRAFAGSYLALAVRLAATDR
jgi:threonine/homoserine/homoserine lactone efflux protein